MRRAPPGRYRGRWMQLAEERPNVELRRDADGSSIVVLAFPYDPHVVALVRRIPGRRFEWDRREWYAPVDDWAGVHVADVVDRFPELTTSTEVDVWLRAVERRWVGRGAAGGGGRGGGAARPAPPRRPRLVRADHARGRRARGAARGIDRARG